MTNMTETDSDITRKREKEGIGTNTNNDDITNGIANGYEDITKGYNERE